MLEQGLVSLINNSSSPPTIAGGFATELPKDYTLTQAVWYYRLVGGSSFTGLQTVRGLVSRMIEIHCVANVQVDANALSHQIDLVVQGFQGTLADPDSTIVSAILRSDEPRDYYDDARRTFRRMREYEILYVEN